MREEQHPSGKTTLSLHCSYLGLANMIQFTVVQLQDGCGHVSRKQGLTRTPSKLTQLEAQIVHQQLDQV